MEYIIAALPILGISVAKGLECRNVDPGELPGFEIGTGSSPNALALDLPCFTIHVASFTDALILIIGDTEDVTPRSFPTMGCNIELDVFSD